MALSIGIKYESVWRIDGTLLPQRVKVDLGIITMKRSSTLFRSPELEPHHQQFNFILRTHFFEGSYTFDGYLVSILRSADNNGFVR